MDLELTMIWSDLSTLATVYSTDIQTSHQLSSLSTKPTEIKGHNTTSCLDVKRYCRSPSENRQSQAEVSHDEKNSPKNYCFFDSGCNKNEDHTSQLGMTIGLVDKHDSFQILRWFWSMYQCAKRSVLASKI